MITSQRHRWLATLSLLLLMAAFPDGISGFQSGGARQNASTSALAGDERLHGTVSATVDWPNGITFHLESDAPQPVTNVALIWWFDENETLHETRIELVGATNRLVESGFVDLLSDYEPPGQKIRYRWRAWSTDGHEFWSASASVEWRDSQFEWRSSTTANVTLWTNDGDDAWQDALTVAAGETVRLAFERYGLTLDRPVRVWIYASQQQFSGVLAPNSETYIAGASYPGKSLILAVIPPDSTFELGRIIPHEIMHQIVYQASKNPFLLPPVWLDEGLAVRMQTAGTAGFDDVVQAAAAADSLPRLRSIAQSFPFDGGNVRIAYAMSWSVVGYIESRFGPEAVSIIVQGLSDGLDYNGALMLGIGLTTDELDIEWQASLADS